MNSLLGFVSQAYQVPKLVDGTRLFYGLFPHSFQPSFFSNTDRRFPGVSGGCLEMIPGKHGGGTPRMQLRSKQNLNPAGPYLMNCPGEHTGI